MKASNVRIMPILRQFTVLNGLLLAGICLFVYLIVVRIMTVDLYLPAPSSVAVNAADQKKEQAAEQVVNPPMQDFAIIAEKNLFHPDRIIPAEKKDVTIPRPEFVLYGTLIVDNVRIAYLSDKKAQRTTPGRGKRQVGLKIGETLSGYTLKEVLHDRAVMVRGDDMIELRVISPESKKERGVAEGGVSALPGAKAARPMMQTPAMQPPGIQQMTPSPAMMPPAPTSQVPAMQQNPVSAPRGGRSSRGR
jgi:hypothetical protein